MNVPGVSNLSCEASKIIVQVMYDNLFEFEKPGRTRKKYLETFSWLISLSFDPSWTAVKAFKKPLFDKVENIINQSAIVVVQKSTVSYQIYSSLLHKF